MATSRRLMMALALLAAGLPLLALERDRVQLRLPVVKAVPPRREQAQARQRRPCSPLAKKYRPAKKAARAKQRRRTVSPKSTG